MEFKGGYSGKTCWVDLSRRKVYIEKVKPSILKLYIGGYGVGAKILYDHVPAWVSPFNPLNLLVFATGPVTGTPAPAASRYTVISRSPQTGYIGDANSGGFFGPELKMAGFDMLIVRGRSIKPSIIVVENGDVRVEDAGEIWGLDAREADRAVRDKLGEEFKVATIGPAGENLVRYAVIANDNAERFAARCGLGAVMGSKRLKAVAVKGTGSVKIAMPDKLLDYVRGMVERRKESKVAVNFSLKGTPGDFEFVYELGDVPIKNWSEGDLEGWEGLTWESYEKEIYVGRRACYNCPVACRRIVKLGDERVEGPEYETVAALGSNCGITDLKAVAEINDLCNRLGLDTISFGSTAAFAMECYEKGLLSKDEVGFELRFGDAEALKRLVEDVTYRRGIGDLLAEGSRIASMHIPGSERYAIQVKGVEIAMHDPRASQGGGLNYATAITGGRHTEDLTIFCELFGAGELGFKPMDRFSPEGKAKLVIARQNYLCSLSAMGFCLFVEIGWATIKDMTSIYRLVTGVEMDKEEFMTAGERIFNLRRIINCRYGLKPSEDTLPERLLKDAKASGGAKGVTVRLSEMLDEYYKLRGWDSKTGMPTSEKIRSLRIE